MANGDIAVTFGMVKVASTADRRLGYDEINKTRDYIATKAILVSSRTAVGKSLIEAANAAAARTAIGLPALGTANTATANAIPVYNAAGQLTTVDPTLSGHTASKGYVDARVVPNDPTFGNVFANGAFYSPNAIPAVSGWTNAYINGPDGRISKGASSRRFKKEIKSWTPEAQATLAMQVVTFRYRAEMFGKDDPARAAAPVEVGLIAEDLHELGLYWLVVYDAEGRPEGVRYERIALALLPIIQAHERRLGMLERALIAGETDDNESLSGNGGA